MAITDIFRRRSTNAVNHPVAGVATLSPFRLGSRRFADAYVLMLLTRIFRGLANVNYVVDERVARRDDVAALADFLNANIQTLTWTMWQRGAIVIDRDDQGRWHAPDPKHWRWMNGEVVNYRLVSYSYAYRYLGRPDLEILRDHIDRLDRLVNADDYLTQSLGAFGILSGKTMGLTQEDKKAFLDGIKRDVGITSDKYQFILMGSDVDFKQVSLPIDQLRLSEKVKEEVMAIAGYFGIPYDLVPLSGKSTYDNQKQAIVDFYRNCIAPLAEVVLEIGRYAIKTDDGMMVPSRSLTFQFDNIPELEADRDDTEKRMERAKAAVDILERVKGIDGVKTDWLKEIINEGGKR